MSPRSPRFSDRISLAATALGGYVFVAGLLSFLGWVLDIPRLTDWANNGISIQPNACLAAAAAGAGILFLARSYRRPAAVLGGVTALLGGSALFQYLTGLNLHIDTVLLFDRTWGQVGTLAPGRMGPPGAVCWSLLGSGLILARGGAHSRRWTVVFASVAMTLASLSLLGYVYDASPLFSLPRLTTIALQTATMILAVSLGSMLLIGERQPAAALADPGTGGLLVRRALPLIVLIPVALGLLRLMGQRAGWYDAPMGVALMTLVLIVILLGNLWWIRGILSRHEAELRQAEDRLRQAARMEAVGRLAGGLAHDFNNQLQSISGLAAFLAKDPGLGRRSLEDLEDIQKSTDRIANLVRQLLAFSRKQVLKPEAVELSAALRDSVTLLRQSVGSSIALELNQAADGVWVRVDRAQLNQILVNLTLNARDAMPAGGTLSFAVTRQRLPSGPDQERGGEYGCLTITDTGRGIAAEDIPLIFEPFFSTKRAGEGSGLGLATVHGIVGQSGGHISVQSRPGQGSSFTVLLPATIPPVPLPSPPAGIRKPAPDRPRILVVEDEPTLRVLLDRVLRDEGYQVMAAPDGQAALTLLEEHAGEVDLVVSDVVMPNMGGAELREILAMRHPGLPTIWMSGFPRNEVFGSVPDDRSLFVQKPIRLSELYRIVREQLSNAQMETGDTVKG